MSVKRLAATAAFLVALTAPAFAAKDALTLGMVLEPPVLDPTAGAASAIREVVLDNLFEGLTRIGPNGEVEPGLAESWTVSPDGTVHTFALRSGVKFHNGTPFDCKIVQFSYGRAVAPDSVNAQKQLFEPIASVECPEPLRAVVTLKRPTSAFLFDMGWGDAVMVAPNSAATNKTNPVGTGPFRFKRWVKGDRVELERNPDYWGQPAKLTAVTFRFISDPSAATAAMLAGDIDAFPNFPAPETLAQFQHDPRFTVDVGNTEGKTIVALNGGRKPFDDPRVRRALTYAVDRKALIEALGGYGAPIGSHYVPQDPGYIDLTGVYPYDPAKAKQLLAEAGVKPGTQITVVLPPPSYARRGGEVIAAMWQQVGIDAKLVPTEWAQWLDQVFKRADYDATVISHTEARDLDIYARAKYYFNYHSPDYDALYQRYATAIKPDEQLALVGDLQRKLTDDAANVFLFALPKLGVWNAKLRGLWHNEPIPANDVTQVFWSD
jgi:peptide/nickel transport system substrate-binding protein